MRIGQMRDAARLLYFSMATSSMRAHILGQRYRPAIAGKSSARRHAAAARHFTSIAMPMGRVNIVDARRRSARSYRHYAHIWLNR